MAEALKYKYEKLKDYIKSLGRVAVAFSGGVDSALLLKVAADVLGENVLAVTAKSEFFPERELTEAAEFCKRYHIRQVFCSSEAMEIPGFVQNPPDKCYLCKRELFGKICGIAEQEGCRAVAEGSNMDDTGDYRPGMRAVKELGVLSPLQEAGLYKQEIRQLSKMLGLPAWDKPSFACLATRFVYGEEITRKKLSMVGEAEQLLLDMGFRQVRVRMHGSMARIEILPEEFERILADDRRLRIFTRLKELGFSYVTLDLGGYRTGSMNDGLSPGKGA